MLSALKLWVSSSLVRKNKWLEHCTGLITIPKEVSQFLSLILAARVKDP